MELSENLIKAISVFLRVKQEQFRNDLKTFRLSWSVIYGKEEGQIMLGLMLTAEASSFCPGKSETVCLAVIPATQKGAFNALRKAANILAACFEGQYRIEVSVPDLDSVFNTPLATTQEEAP